MSFPRLRASLFSILTIFGSTSAWGEAITLSNEHIEISVDPAKGLILGFNLPGEKNLLWLNPNPISDPNRNAGWVNFGGDKLWWGPMMDWQKVKGRRFPPDEALAGVWMMTEQSVDQVTIESGVSPWVGIRGEREITLSPDRAEVSILNRFTRVNPSSQRLQLWTVSQMPIAEWCLLDSHPLEAEEPYVNLREGQFDPHPYTVVLSELQAVRFNPAKNTRNMIGTRGAWIAAVYEKHIIIHEIEPQPEAQYARKVSLQLYNSLEFIELETLSGNATPLVGESMDHLVRWHVLDRPRSLSDAALAAWIVEQMSRSDI